VSRGLSSLLARLLGLASTVCSLLVIAGFVLFVVNQTKAASSRQQALLSEPGGAAQEGSGARRNPAGEANTVSTSANGLREGETASSPRESEGGLQTAIHGAAKALRSPFAALTASSHSRWVIELVGTALALLLYGFILRYLMRVLTVRVRT
jgi:hypothetical protein